MPKKKKKAKAKAKAKATAYASGSRIKARTTKRGARKAKRAKPSIGGR